MALGERHPMSTNMRPGSFDPEYGGYLSGTHPEIGGGAKNTFQIEQNFRKHSLKETLARLNPTILVSNLYRIVYDRFFYVRTYGDTDGTEYERTHKR